MNHPPQPTRTGTPARLGLLALLCVTLALGVVGCSSPRSTATSTTSSSGQDEIALFAMSLVGTPYKYGGNTPEGGFDCSGLVGYVWHKTLNTKLPRTSREIGARGNTITPEALSAGDLVFYNTDGNNPYSHVGIYVGQGRMVHAPNSGGTVRLESMQKNYWQQRFTEARRLSPQTLGLASQP